MSDLCVPGGPHWPWAQQYVIVMRGGWRPGQQCTVQTVSGGPGCFQLVPKPPNTLVAVARLEQRSGSSILLREQHEGGRHSKNLLVFCVGFC